MVINKNVSKQNRNCVVKFWRRPLRGFRFETPPITTLAIVLTDHVLIMKIAGIRTQYTCSIFMTPANYGTNGYQLIANETAM